MFLIQSRLTFRSFRHVVFLYQIPKESFIEGPYHSLTPLSALLKSQVTFFSRKYRELSVGGWQGWSLRTQPQLGSLKEPCTQWRIINVSFCV